MSTTQEPDPATFGFLVQHAEKVLILGALNRIIKCTILMINDASWSHHSIIRWLLFQWQFRRGPLQPPEFRRLGWSSLRPEPLSSPPFVLKTSLQNNDFKPMHSQKVLVLHFHMFFTFPNGCHFRFSTQTSNELPSRSACYSDDTQGNPLFYKWNASK